MHIHKLAARRMNLVSLQALKFSNDEAIITKEIRLLNLNKKRLKNVGPIRHCEPPHAHSPGVASGTVARRLRIDVHDDNDNA